MGFRFCVAIMPSDKIYQCRVLRDVFPPTPPGPEGSNGNGLFRVQWSPVPGFSCCLCSADALVRVFAGNKKRGGYSRSHLSHMTKRLYYDQPDLLQFDSVVEE